MMKIIIIALGISSCLGAALNNHAIAKRQADHLRQQFGVQIPNLPFNLPPNFPFHNPSFQTPINPFNPQGGIYDQLDRHFLPANHKCVKPYNLSVELGPLSDSAEGYPFDAINLERSQRPDLAFYLPPALTEVTDGVYGVDNSFSCPTTRKRMRSFARYGGRCWVLSDLQEIDYGYCSNNYCSNHYDSSFYARNMCMEQFETLYVWVYCDNFQVPNLRIRQEAIRVPKFCSCKNMKCI
ncbi:uncharacterized protein [Haliotis cracherodii]|uniref:uncharacterized protein n=1 Tax=Haliotis cracherodii TaxID=6455 RepID=UPI0039EC4BC6